MSGWLKMWCKMMWKGFGGVGDVLTTLWQWKLQEISGACLVCGGCSGDGAVCCECGGDEVGVLLEEELKAAEGRPVVIPEVAWWELRQEKAMAVVVVAKMLLVVKWWLGRSGLVGWLLPWSPEWVEWVEELVEWCVSLAVGWVRAARVVGESVSQRL